MYDINVKNVKKRKSKNLDSTIISKNVEISSYTNDEGTTMYSPIYYYEVDEKTYTCESSSSSSINPGTKKQNSIL